MLELWLNSGQIESVGLLIVFGELLEHIWIIASIVVDYIHRLIIGMFRSFISIAVCARSKCLMFDASIWVALDNMTWWHDDMMVGSCIAAVSYWILTFSKRVINSSPRNLKKSLVSMAAKLKGLVPVVTLSFEGPHIDLFQGKPLMCLRGVGTEGLFWFIPATWTPITL